MDNHSKPSIFFVKDCALAAIATGIKAQTLTEFRDRLSETHLGSIYYHFWGGRLRIGFEHREYHNDFSYWAHHSLHDEILAEQLEMLDPTDYDNLEHLKNDIIEIVERRLEEREIIPWAKVDEQFYFMRSKIVVFQTRYQAALPSELVNIIPHLTHSSIFYHFIDSSRRVSDKSNDFTAWLSGFGNQYQDLIEEMRKIDPYFISLGDLKLKLVNLFVDYFVKA